MDLCTEPSEEGYIRDETSLEEQSLAEQAMESTGASQENMKAVDKKWTLIWYENVFLLFYY